MNSMPFRQLKSFFKILIGVQYDHLCLQMVDRQIVSPRFLSCSSFAKEKMDGAGAPQVLQHRLSLSAESGIPPRRERPTNRKKATPSRRWLTLFSEIAHKFRYTVLRQNCHMVLQRLANLPLLYHWRFFSYGICRTFPLHPQHCRWFSFYKQFSGVSCRKPRKKYHLLPLS